MTIAQQPLTNAKVALFFDVTYTFINGSTAEGNGVQRALAAAGHTVTTFAGTSTDAWMNATKGVDVLVIPELGKTAGAPPLSPGAMFFVKNFVSNGGTLIVDGGSNGAHSTELIDALFDQALVQVASTAASTPTASVAGTTYEGGDSSLPDNSDTGALGHASLPTFAESFYNNLAGDLTVAGFQYGQGQVIWLGWDWFDALPPPGNYDGGWNDTLYRSVSLSDFNPNGVIFKGTHGNDRVNPVALSDTSTDLDDVIMLKKGNDKAFGGGGHDIMEGGKGNDKLHGGDGDDFLTGGKNKDKLWGDAGNDYFIFDQKPGKLHADKIKDFVDGDDLMILKASKFDGLTAGEMTALQFDQHIDYNSHGWLSFDHQKFAKLQSGGIDIDHTDFLVI